MHKKEEWETSFSAGKDYNPLNQVLLDKISEHLKIRECAIDLGCGTGDSLIKLSKLGFSNIFGIDWSENALKRAKDRLDLACVKAELIEANLDSISQIHNRVSTADFILAKLIIAFIENKDLFLQEVSSLMKEDGVFVVITPVLYDKYTYSDEDKPHIAVSYVEILNLLTHQFKSVTELNHSYYGERGDLVTFLCLKN